MGKGTAKKLAIGTALAAATGYVVGILTAPKSGKETRQDIKDAAVKTKDEAQKQIKKLHAELDELASKAKYKASEMSDRTRAELESLVSRAKDAKDKAGEMVSGLKDGDSADKDLQKAIDDAKKAVDHLRDYLSK